jgi:hypothetical protein
MATPLYRLALKAFWRRMENVQVTITAASPDTYSGNIQRFTWTTGSSVPGLVDELFYQAGQELIRVLQALTYDEIYKISPTLITNEVVTLTAGTGTLVATNVGYLFDRQKIYTTGGGAITRIGKMLNTLERDEIINNLNIRKTPSTSNPYFEVLGLTVNGYPSTFTRIDLRWLKSCPLQISSDANSDIFPENLIDIWVDITCRIAAGDLKDSLEQVIARKLQEKFTFLHMPKLLTPKTQEIQR